jgi:[acyl-carrier-protein] S-malonyltransferase
MCCLIFVFDSQLSLFLRQNNDEMKAYVFPGQGAQFSGMGKDLYDNSDTAKEMFNRANEILGFDITKIMFEGSADELKETKVTQPAIFLHSTILAACLGDGFKPNMVAGHSLGEFSSLVANKALSFEDGLRLVSKRALAMQAACENQPSTMAAILGLDDDVVESLCAKVDGVVVAANYNCPGQLVISGAVPAVEKACELATEAGARRALILPVGGAFHSPLMEPAREELAEAIEATRFDTPTCPVYQNVVAKAVIDPSEIKKNLVAQLTAPVRWTQIMHAMIADGAEEVVEVGPGKVLQGLFKKVDRKFPTASAELTDLN